MPSRSARIPAARPAPPRAGARVRYPRHLVTAVLVAHDGAGWLPTVLAALAAQARPAQRTIAVDTGSRDATASLLTGAFDVSDIVTAPRRTSYGEAIALGLAASSAPANAVLRARSEGEPVEWVWLLHDDCAPDPDCLEALLELADQAPSAAVIGPKVHDWGDPQRLVEAGLTTDTAGRLVTGLDPDEVDQGQHDAVRDVLAVGTAGALVRRDVWDALGGFDSALPLLRDDVDFGWRVNAAGHRVVVAPRASVRHARATVTGRRRPSAAAGRVSGIDRRHALYTLLANVGTPALLIAVPRMLLGAVVRAVVLVLTRRPPAAAEEITALAYALGNPRRLAAARRRRAAARALPPRAVGHLLAGRVARLRHYVEALADLGTGDAPASISSPGARSGETGPSQADEELTAGRGGRLVRRLLWRPGVALVLGLLAVALLAEHALLGGGRLSGGALLPAPGGASDLWSTYLAGWHRVGAGSAAAAPPYLGVLAGLSTLLLGKAWLAVDVLLLGGVPLAGLSAYAATRRIVASRPLRCWAAASYALLPVVTGAVAAGRLGVVVAAVALPPLLVGCWRVLHDDPRDVGWRHAWASGLGLALAAAFAPMLYPVVGVLLAGAAAAVLLASTPAGRAAALRRVGAVGILAAVPVLVLFPWSADVVVHPAVLLLGIGRSSIVGADPGWQLAVLHPGGPALPPAWLGVPVLAAALAGLLWAGRRAVALGGWALAAVGFTAAGLSARLSVPPAAGGPSMPGWPGVGLTVAAAGLLLAALVAGDEAPARLARHGFGWRQPLAGLLTIGAVLVPAVAAGSWLTRGAADPVARNPVAVLPAFARALVGPQERVLYLRETRGGAVSYALAGASGARLGDSALVAAPGQRRALAGLVRRLVSARGSTAAIGLATYDVRFVVLGGPGTDVAERLDAQAGLSRTSYQGASRLWAVTPSFGRLAVLSPDRAAAALRGALPGADAVPDREVTGSGPLGAHTQQAAGTLPAGSDRAAATVPAGAPGRLLVLSEARAGGWTATVNGRRLPPRTAWGWAQAFALPPSGGDLRLSYDAHGRDARLLAEAILLGLVVILAAPGPRRANAGGTVPPAAEAAQPLPAATAAIGGAR